MPHRPDHAAPLSLAAYVTWLAVATAPVMTLWRQGWPPSLMLLAGLVGLCAVLLLFVGREASTQRPLQKALTLAQLPAALLAFAAFRDGLQPILLILIAAQAAALFDTRRLLWLMALANGLLVWLMLRDWSLVQTLVSALSYIGFQCFAAITVRAMAQAQSARDDAQRINAELLATRALLAEGARAEERLHLSRELHDVAGHKLTALKLQLGLCAPGSGEASIALAASRQLADELLADVRGVVGALRAHDGVDLHAALGALAASIPSPRISLALADDARPADFARAQALLRAAQEGVTNALRHAGASTLHIELVRAAGLVKLSVIDNGRGPEQSKPGNGLTGLQERLAAVGGSVQLDVLPQGGSALTATVPA
ncbi:MAG: histidine kinase [Pseudomonadota bacterium]